MMNVIKLPLIASLCMAMTVAACGSGAAPVSTVGPNGQKLSPAQIALRQQAADYEKVVEDSTTGGVILGALAGAALGALVSGDVEGAVVGGVAGGVAGGVIGNQYGNYLVRKDNQFKSDQASLDQDIKAARVEAERSQKNVSIAKSILNENRRELASLRRKVTAGQASKVALNQRIGTLNQDITLVNQMIKTGNERLATLENNTQRYRAAGRNITALRAVGQQEAQRIAELQRIASELAAEKSIYEG
jgi:hypothetical protein